MFDINLIAVIVSATAAFILSAVWYVILSGPMTKLQKNNDSDNKMPPWKVLAELLRSLVVAAVISLLIVNLQVSSFSAAIFYSIAIWLAFPVVLLAGSVIHENVPVKLAAIHAGDWLLKLLLLTSIAYVWN